MKRLGLSGPLSSNSLLIIPFLRFLLSLSLDLLIHFHVLLALFVSFMCNLSSKEV